MKAQSDKILILILFIWGNLLGVNSFSTVNQSVTEELDWLSSHPVDRDGFLEVVVFIENESTRSDLMAMSARPDLSRPSRITSVTRRLMSARVRGSDEVARYLSAVSPRKITRHWIVPAFTAFVRPVDIEQLLAIEGVSRIVPNVPVEAVTAVDAADPPSLSPSVSDQLNMLGVPQVWTSGLTGKGRLVCSFDTGVEQIHPALSSKWRGNHAPLSACWLSSVRPDEIPSDIAGHGTHTMGIMVGSTPTSTFGVAPDAEWIAAGVVDQGRPLQSTISDILKAFQWTLNPDGDESTTDDVPDVILNSWGIPAGIFAPCDQTFWQVIDNVEAAGIVTIFSAGNEGPAPKTIRNPADRASGPLNSFAVGAVDNAKVIAGFSSRGPASCDTTKIKPEVVAPGVSIYSSTTGGGYKIMSGTSMAAPYIAGLVALCREYNPDATVEQIKWAIIKSAEDLGPTGEDNAYGYGLVNAARMIDFLPEPSIAHFALSDIVVLGDGALLPGKNVELRLTLTNISGNFEIVSGRLRTADPSSVIITSDRADFVFGVGGTLALNSVPFELFVDSNLIHGDQISFDLELLDQLNQPIGTLDFSIMVGYEAPGSMGVHESGRIRFTVSDFGQFGLAPGSIYNLAGEGFRFDNHENLLYEAGIIIGRDSHRLSSAVRDSLGVVRPSDFTPIEGLSAGWSDSQQGIHRIARFADTAVDQSVPITIEQETIDFAGVDNDGMILFHYRLANRSDEPVTGLHFGFLVDFDLDAAGDRIIYDNEMNMMLQSGTSEPMVGLIALENINSFKTLINADGKRGLSSSEQYDLISLPGDPIDSPDPADVMFVVSTGAIALSAFESVELAFALLAGENIEALYECAERARYHYDSVTSVDDRPFGLPDSYVLNQNYPNPFNPATTISFVLPAVSETTLDIFNILGQQVRQLHSGVLPVGYHSIEWNGQNDAGVEVASGVYFYRLTVGDYRQSRKMVLLR